MTKLESLERLREFADAFEWADEIKKWVLDCYDEIQSEIDARFMELPVDAVGVVIRPGDNLMIPVRGTLEEKWLGPFEAAAVSEKCVYVSTGNIQRADECKHAEPEPTVEDLLRGFYFDAKTQCDGNYGDLDGELIAEYADRLREAVRGE